MMRKNIFKRALSFFTCALFAGSISASNPVHAGEQTKRQVSVETLVGYYSSKPCDIGPDMPDSDYVLAKLRVGVKKRKDNLEALAEIYGSPFCDGFANYIVGVSFLLRYNLVPHNWKITPYGQAGVGVACTDGDKDKSQNIGLQFNLQAGLGARYHINKDSSINIEFMLDHYSDGGVFKDINANSYGLLFGFTRNF